MKWGSIMMNAEHNHVLCLLKSQTKRRNCAAITLTVTLLNKIIFSENKIIDFFFNV